jgi:hypothetical protein
MTRVLATARSRRRRVVMEQLLDTLCNKYRPELHSLVHNPQIPDGHLTVLLEWADDLAAADPSSGLDLEVLEEVLPALNAAFLASFPLPECRRGTLRCADGRSTSS